MRRIIIRALLLMSLLPTSVSAQDSFEAFASANLVSRYMWRGIDMAGPSLQPELGIAWKGLSLTAEANTPFDDDGTKDIDITLTYSLGNFNIGITDYWTAEIDEHNRYFHYSGGLFNPHQFEANIGYTCKYGSIQAYTMFAGNDYKISGDRAYSTFVELTVPFSAGGLDWELCAGISPMESAGLLYPEAEASDDSYDPIFRPEWMYGDSFTCNMVSLRATKEFEFKYFKMPIFVEMHTNPYAKKANLLFGISITTL